MRFVLIQIWNITTYSSYTIYYQISNVRTSSETYIRGKDLHQVLH